MVIKTNKKPKILIFIGVHPGLKFAPIRFVHFVRDSSPDAASILL